MLNIRVVVFLLLVTFTRQGKMKIVRSLHLCIAACNSCVGSAQSSLCSRDTGCVNTFNEDSVRDCCVQEDVLSVIPAGDEVCRLCYGMLNIMYKKCRFVIYFVLSSVWMGGRHCSRQ